MKILLWTLVLNVIVGIGTGLSVQPIQRWWEKRAISSQSKRTKRIREEYTTATYFALHPEFLACKLVLTCIGVCAYIVYLLFLVKLDVTPIHAGAGFPKFSFTIPRYIMTMIEVGNMLLITVLTTFIGRTALNAFSFFERVRNFKGYVEKVPMEIRDVELEKVIIAIARERPTAPLSSAAWRGIVGSMKDGREKTDGEAGDDSVSP